MFSLKKGGFSDHEAALPSEALVIVIQNANNAILLPTLLQWRNAHRYQCEPLSVVRRRAEKAYALQAQFATANIVASFANVK